jgi:chemotaxis protein methyltransferase CheR
MFAEISQNEFDAFRSFIKEKVGISLSEQKASMVRGRLAKRLKALELNSYQEYLHILQTDDDEFLNFISAISTNVTSFFRAPAQWQFLSEHSKEIFGQKNKKLRIWSAACSSGEEPYTIMMFLKDTLPNFDMWDIKMLATDISPKVLKKAIAGEYLDKDISGLDPKLLNAHFYESKNLQGQKVYTIKSNLRDKILFRMFNLVNDRYFFKNNFDMIFCRNVMIYFDAPTRAQIIDRFVKLLPKNGLLFLGESEAITERRDDLRLIKACVYKKV